MAAILDNVTLNSGLETIGEYCFCNCAVSQITIPGTVGSYCGRLCVQRLQRPRERDIEQRLGTIEGNCFCECPITQITIPGTVKTLGEYAFKGCKSLESVTLSEGVESIGRYAFYACSAAEGRLHSASVTKD